LPTKAILLKEENGWKSMVPARTLAAELGATITPISGGFNVVGKKL
jgi:hypothetical protein